MKMKTVSDYASKITLKSFDHKPMTNCWTMHKLKQLIDNERDNWSSKCELLKGINDQYSVPSIREVSLSNTDMLINNIGVDISLALFILVMTRRSWIYLC